MPVVKDLERQPYSGAAAEPLPADSEREAAYRAALDQAPQAILTLSAEGRVETWNEAASLMFALSAPVAVGRLLSELLGPQSEDFNYLWERSRRGLAVRQQLIRLRIAAGGQLDAIVSFVPLTVPGAATGQTLVFLEDVTARERALDKLRKSENRYRKLLADISDIVYERDLEGIVRSVNPAITRILGWTPEEVIGRSLIEFIHPDEQQSALDEARRFVVDPENREPQGTYRFVHKDSGYRYLELIGSPRRQEGQVVGVSGIGRDVTERVLAEAKLRENERFVREMADTTPNLMYVYDVQENRNRYVNQQITPLLGYTREQMERPGFFASRVHSEDLERMAQRNLSLRRDRSPQYFEDEVRVRSAQGIWRTFFQREVVFSWTEAGTPSQILGVAFDITERKRVEAELQRKQRLLEGIASAAPVNLYVLDLARQRFTYATPAIERQLGYTVEEWLALGAAEYEALVHPADQRRLREELAGQRRELQPEQTLTYELRLRHKHGDWRSVRVREVAFEHEPGGRVATLLAAATDVTYEKRVQQELAEQTRFLESVAATMPVVLHLVDLKRQTVSYVSPHLERLLGYPVASLLGQPKAKWDALLHPDDARQVSDKRLRHLDEASQAGPFVYQYRARTAKGAWRWLETHEVLLPGETGLPEQVLAATVDITQQKLADDEVAAGKRRYQQLVESLDGIVWEMDLKSMRFTYVSPHAEKMLGYPVAAWLEAGFFDRIVHPEDREWVLRYCETETRRQRDHQMMYRVISASGRTHWVQDTITVVLDDRGEAVGLRGIYLDLTAQKQAEEAYLESEARLRRLVEDADDLFILYDLEQRVQYFKAPSYVALPEELVIGKKPAEFLPTALALQVKLQNERVLHTGKPENFENCFDMGSDRIWFSDHVYPVYDKAGRPSGVGRICRNITQQKKAEAAQEELRLLLERMATFSPCIHYVFDVQEGRYLFLGRSFERVLGYSPERVLSENEAFFESIMHPEDWADLRNRRAHWDAAADDEVVEAEYRYRHASGQYRWLRVQSVVFARDAQGAVRQRLGVAMDVTAERAAEEYRRTLEARIQQSQKLESLGILAGGIAHDFNNLLTAILGNASLMRTQLPPGSPGAELTQEIELAGRRAAELTQQMMAYAGKGRLEYKPVQLTELVREVHRLLRKVVSPQATFSFDLPENLPLVDGDATQLRQVLMNLIKNAAEALQDKSGSIFIRLAAVELSHLDLATSLVPDAAKPGPHVLVEVRDTGCGMTAATLERIFDPFFTTKFTGRGLGLSAVLGIVRGHKGTLRVATAPEEGTRFQLYFPVSKRAAAEEREAKALPPAPPKRILLVEDNASVADLTSRILRRSGYTVQLLADGNEGLAYCQRHPEQIDLAILDLSLPGITGDRLAIELRGLMATLPIIVMSGNFNPTVIDALQKVPGLKLLTKPFTPSQLLQAMQGCARQAQE